MYDIEKIIEPKTVENAIFALRDDPKALLICGGSDILIKIREGKLAGCSLISLQKIDELQGITLLPNGTIKIGPSNTFAQVTQHSIIEKNIPALGRAVDQAGGPQLRNIGTIGGNICNGVTSADSAATLLTLNAALEITGINGKRIIAMEDFYKGPGKVDLQPTEILTAILLKEQDYKGFGGHYIKYAMREAMDIATLGCAVHVKLDDTLCNIAEMRLAFGVASPTPIRCKKTEELVVGKPITEELFTLVGKNALYEVSPRTSWRASKEFRQQLVFELSQRALKQAIENAGGTV